MTDLELSLELNRLTSARYAALAAYETSGSLSDKGDADRLTLELEAAYMEWNRRVMPHKIPPLV